MRKKLNLIPCKLLPAIRYHTQSVPYTDAQLGLISSIYTQIVKQCIPIPTSTDSYVCGIPRKAFGLEAMEVLDDLHRSLSTNLISLLRDESHIGLTTKSIWAEAHRRLGKSLISLPNFTMSSIRAKSLLPTLRLMNIMYSHLGIEVAPTWQNTNKREKPSSPLLFDLLVSSYPEKPTILSYPETWALHHMWENGLYHLSDIVTPDGRALDPNIAPLMPNQNETQRNNLKNAIKILHLSLHNTHYNTKRIVNEEIARLSSLQLPSHLQSTNQMHGRQLSHSATTIRSLHFQRPSPHPQFIAQFGAGRALASHVTAEYMNDNGQHTCIVALQPLRYANNEYLESTLHLPGVPISNHTYLKPIHMRVNSHYLNDTNHPLTRLLLLFRRQPESIQWRTHH